MYSLYAYIHTHTPTSHFFQGLTKQFKNWYISLQKSPFIGISNRILFYWIFLGFSNTLKNWTFPKTFIHI